MLFVLDLVAAFPSSNAYPFLFSFLLVDDIALFPIHNTFVFVSIQVELVFLLPPVLS